jgi:hypothetical protein
MSFNISSALASPVSSTSATGLTQGLKGGSKFEQIFADFKKAAQEGPVARIRQAVLKKHNLDDNSYKALPPAERKSIDDEVAQTVKRALTKNGEQGQSASSLLNLG